MGMDNNMATEPEEMRALIEGCHKVYSAMGSYERIVQGHEMGQRQKMRRSIVANQNISKGTVLTEDMLEAKRPGTGISVADLSQVIGKVALSDIPKESLIRPEDIK